jgi:putative ABC transport system permease protein
VSVPTWIDFAAPLGMLALTGLAAAIPALRGGRLSAVQAIAAGQAPPAGRGYQPHRLAGRLPLPRPVTVGLAAPFSRPARSSVMLLSITAGLLAVVMATGLTDSIHKINHSAIQGLGQVQVIPRGVRGAALTPGQAATVAAAVRSQPGTRHYVAESNLFYTPPGFKVPKGAGQSPTRQPVTIAMPGLSQPASIYAYDGNPSWLGWALVAGRWYRSGEIDASPQLLAAIHKNVGQDITITVDGEPVTVRIAGEVFVPNPGPAMFVSWQTLGRTAAAKLAGNIASYDINLTPGTTTGAYIAALTRKLGTADYFVVTPAGPSVAAQIKSSHLPLWSSAG